MKLDVSVCDSVCSWSNESSDRSLMVEMEMFYLTTHSTHFIYGYMASDIWLRTILIVRKETRCRHIGYSLRLTARVLLYAPSHRQDSTYHSLCYTSRGALAPHGGFIELFLIPASAAQLVFSWDGVCKRSLAAYQKE